MFEAAPCAAERDEIAEGVDDRKRPDVPTWGGRGGRQALRHARYTGWGGHDAKLALRHARYARALGVHSPHHAKKPMRLSAMPMHMQPMQPRTRSLKDMLGHSGFRSGSTVPCIA